MQRPELPYYEAGILSRLVVTDESSLSRAMAEGILTLGFDQTDKDRMRDLAAKARAGALTPEQQAEIEAYSRVGSLIGILHSKARQALKGSCGRKNKASIH